MVRNALHCTSEQAVAFASLNVVGGTHRSLTCPIRMVLKVTMQESQDHEKDCRFWIGSGWSTFTSVSAFYTSLDYFKSFIRRSPLVAFFIRIVRT
jgi:hypothetical protein